MYAILGAVSLVAGAALLRYAMIANQRSVKPAWTANWMINGAMAPAVITLLAIGIIFVVPFGLAFVAGAGTVIEALVAFAIVAGGIVLWRNWKPETAAAQPTPVRPVGGVGQKPAGTPFAPPRGAAAGGKRRTAA